MRRALLLACIVGTSGAIGCLDGSDEGGPPVEAPPPPEPFAFAGTGCSEVALLVPVDAPSVRGYVPAQYAIVGEATGRTTLLVFVMSCEALAVDNATEPTLASGVGPFVEAPDGSAGTHLYEIWHLTGHRELRERFHVLNMLGGLVTNITLDAGSPTPLTFDVAGDVPWGDSAYQVAASASAQVPAAMEFAAMRWHTSEGVTIRTTYAVTDGAPAAATGEVHTETHTPLGHMLGGESGRGAGLFFAFDFEATVEIVPT